MNHISLPHLDLETRNMVDGQHVSLRWPGFNSQNASRSRIWRDGLVPISGDGSIEHVKRMFLRGEASPYDV